MIGLDTTPLPTPPDGWFVYSYYLLSDGALAALWTDRDINTEYHAWLSVTETPNFRGKMPELWDGNASLAVIEPTGSSDTITMPLVRYPKIDRFPDGRWLVASSRAARDDRNAKILDPDGEHQSAFNIGDGIEHLRCAPDGRIWVGYFDEGVFGDTVGRGGIVHFSHDGKPLWSYNDKAGNSRSIIDDCYALTLDGDALWACFYSDFPLVQIEGENETLWNNEVSWAKALAVDGSLVLLAGGFGDNADKLSLMKLGQNETQCLGSCRCSAIENAQLLSGRSSTIHTVKDSVWTRINVSKVSAELGSP